MGYLSHLEHFKARHQFLHHSITKYSNTEVPSGSKTSFNSKDHKKNFKARELGNCRLPFQNSPKKTGSSIEFCRDCRGILWIWTCHINYQLLPGSTKTIHCETTKKIPQDSNIRILWWFPRPVQISSFEGTMFRFEVSSHRSHLTYSNMLFLFPKFRIQRKCVPFYISVLTCSPATRWLSTKAARNLSFSKEIHKVYIWLVVSTQLKNISQNGNLPQFSGWKFQKYLSCHHLDINKCHHVCHFMFEKILFLHLAIYEHVQQCVTQQRSVSKQRHKCSSCSSRKVGLRILTSNVWRMSAVVKEKRVIGKW